MRTRTLSLVVFGTTALTAIIIAACSSDSGDSGQPTTDAGTQQDTSTAADTSTPTDSSTGQDSGSDTSTGGGGVTFSYTPQWKGVQTVEVYGAFGTSTDWTAPLVTLADSGSGTFTGTALVPPGQYPYVFKVTGDADATKPATYARYAIDPTNPSFTPCPKESPTFDKAASNPCSQLTSPQPVVAPMYHFKGLVTSGGSPIKGFLVVLEREEAQSHHFFVNRITTSADGAFDLQAATGMYRVQVLTPTYETMTDTMRMPDNETTLRRSISSALMLTADTTINAAEVAYPDYPTMTPQGDAGPVLLPATFSFTVMPGAQGARLTLYGPTAEIGDPWYMGALGTTGAASWDGGFNTDKAPDSGLAPDAQYWWGTEQQFAKGDASVSWTAQTMVFPVKFE